MSATVITKPVFEDDDCVDQGIGTGAIVLIVKSEASRCDVLKRLEAGPTGSFRIRVRSQELIALENSLPDVDVLVLEMRVAEAFEDLEIVQSVQRLRPLMPIVVLSANDNLEIKVMTLRAGAVDFQSTDLSYIELVGRIESLSRVGRAVRVVEVQNKELISSMQALQVAEVERANSQAVIINTAKMASLGEMAGNVAHEINNPLTVLNGRLAQMRKIFQDKEPIDRVAVERLIDGMATITKRIGLIAKGLRSVSRMGTKDPFDVIKLEDLIAQTLAFCTEGIREKGVTFNPPVVAPDIEFQGRFTQISQVLLNLLNNARDAVEGIENAWIVVSVEDRPTEIIIAVTDSGLGVPKELVQKIYLPFFTTKPVNKGTGLGLSISRTILEEHRGSLYIDETCPNTRFIMKLPKLQI